MLSKTCLICFKNYLKPKSTSLRVWNNSKYCSNQCVAKRNLGHTPWNKNTKGIYKAWNKGKICPQFSGKNNGAWRGTDDKYFRYKTLERDNYTCVECGHNEPEIMEVDHIKQKSKFPELRYTLSNLQTLCPNCHKRKTIKQLKEPRQKNKQIIYARF